MPAGTRASSASSPPVPTVTCSELDERLREWTLGTPGLREWLTAQRGLEPCTAEALRTARTAEDWLGFELYVIAAMHNPSGAYTETLCGVLDERRDDLNSEDIVDAMFRIADPASLPCLRRAASWVPDWDEHGQLARKAVWALDRIGTPDAEQAIRELEAHGLPFKVAEA